MSELGLALGFAVRFACLVTVAALVSESLVEHGRSNVA